MRGFRANFEKFQAENIAIIEISCDSLAVQKAWVASLKEDGDDDDADGEVPFPVASDFWPHGEVARAYGVFNDERGNSRRSVFIIDAEGMIRWSNVYVDSIPGSGDLLFEIERLKPGGSDKPRHPSLFPESE